MPSLVATADEKVMHHREEWLGLPASDALGDGLLGHGDVGLQFVKVFIVQALLAPGEIGIQSCQPEALEAGYEVGGNLGDGFEASLARFTTKLASRPSEAT